MFSTFTSISVTVQQDKTCKRQRLTVRIMLETCGIVITGVTIEVMNPVTSLKGTLTRHNVNAEVLTDQPGWSKRLFSFKTNPSSCSHGLPCFISAPPSSTFDLTFFPDKGQRPGEDVHKVGQPVGVGGAVKLPDVHHIVLVFQHRS